MTPEIVCIGQAVVDCITRGYEQTPHKKNVFRAENISLRTGGDALNESVLLSRMGHKVCLVCGIGNDIAGQIIIDKIKRNNVHTDFITVSGHLSTPIANLIVDMDGNRRSINSPATMLGNYSPDVGTVRGAKVVSLASLFRAPLDRKDVIINLIRAAKEENAIICADTKLPTYRDIHLKDLAEILPLIDYIFPNETEAEYYTGEKDFMSMAKCIHELGVHNVIIKAGAKGCVVCGDDGTFSMPARPVKAADSTGAGDSFVAGFISSLLKGKNLYECCENGTLCAAECVQHIGAT